MPILPRARVVVCVGLSPGEPDLWITFVVKGKWTSSSKYGRLCSYAHSRVSSAVRSGFPSWLSWPLARFVEPALVLAFQLMVEDDTFDVRAAFQEPRLGLFVRTIHLEVDCRSGAGSTWPFVRSWRTWMVRPFAVSTRLGCFA